MPIYHLTGRENLATKFTGRHWLCGKSLRLFALALLIPTLSAAAPLVIDDFSYTNSTRARAAWVNTGAPAVNMATGGEWGPDEVMVLTCDFATRSTRCIWDRTVSLDLRSYAELELEVYAPDPGAISYFTLYFRSGAGWYGASAPLKQAGWQTLRFGIGDFIPEGTPAGWGQINGIRLSPWKAAARNTYLAVRQLRAVTPTVLLVKDTGTSNPEIVQQTIDRHVTWLDEFSIRSGVITRTAVEGGLLQQSRVAILPYNESVSEAEMAQYESYVAAGGKLIVYYLLPSRLASLLGVRVTGWTRGDFAAWMFSDPLITNLPARVQQASWNITIAETNGTANSRVSARWVDSQGRDTGRAAWLASDHGFFMSHVLLGDDAAQKSTALLCLVGSIVPDVWPAAASAAIDVIGRVGPYSSYEQAVPAIQRQAAPTLRATLVEGELRSAETNRLRAEADELAGRFAEAISSAHQARTHLRQAYALSLKPVFPEFRAIWEHHATGPYPGNWPAAVDALATNRLNAVFPNMLWGGLAHYNSAYLPRSEEFALHGDQVSACVAAAHASGIEVHVWKVNWNLLGAPQSFIDAMRAANRTQVSRTGAAIDWLCPSHPDNLALETNSMLEVVRNYDVDGIHFDYIRYPDSDYCYCTGCAERFQSQTGRTLTNWPGDVLATGAVRNAFLDWRRAQITRLVESVYLHTKALKPDVQVSAAVFSDAESAYDGVGQDWRRWITNGILDFVCPMDYTTEFHNFTNLVAQQLTYAGGKIPVYPGIGAFVLDTDGALAQIKATRDSKTGGFILFELSPGSAAVLLPAMGAGATAADEPDTDGDALPDSWETRWFGHVFAAEAGTDSDQDKASDWVEYIAGTVPTNGASGLSLRAEWTNQQVAVSFEARGTEGEGYRNAARHYRLETAVAPDASAGWSPVTGLQDRIAGPGVITVTHSALPDSGQVRYFRLAVWLQQKE